MLAVAGCSGREHNADARTAPDQVAIAPEAGATPFGVMSSGARASALPVAPSAVPSATGSAAAPGAESSPVTAATSAGAAPQILSVHTSPAIVHDGDTLLWTVQTTPDVVDVVAHVTVYAFRLQKHGTGQYVLTFTIPHGVPGFFHGSYTLDLVARSASGAEAKTKVPVAFQ